MVYYLRKVFCLSFMLLAIGCTEGAPEVSALGSTLFMSSKSPSPFDQENTGEYLIFSGQCVGLVNRFQFRLDNLPWEDVPASAATPASGESPPVPSTYDVNCGDGNFNFYYFMSQINNYIMTQTGDPDYDPARVEIQGLDINNNVVPGTILFQRLPAVALRIDPDFHNNNSASWWTELIENEQTIRLRISLIDATGKQVRRYSTEGDLTVNLSTALVSGTSASTGFFFPTDGMNNCLPSVITTATFQAGGGGGSSESITICYTPSGVTAAATVRLNVTATGLTPTDKQFLVLNPNQAINMLVAGNGFNQSIPNILVRGALYKFRSNLSPLDTHQNQRVQSFEGSHLINANSTSVNFLKASRDYTCTGTGVRVGSIDCSASSAMNFPFIMNILATDSAGTLSLSMNSSPVPACSNCEIDTQGKGDGIVPIAGYQTNSQFFEVVGGPTTYSQPRLFYDDRIKDGECREATISLANANGHTIPGVIGFNPLLTVEVSLGSGITFYQNQNCTTYARGPNGVVTKIIPKGNGQFYIAGSFTTYNGEPRNGLALINEDGSLDENYNPSSPGIIFDLVPLDDGKVIIAGDFAGRIQLLNENGQPMPGLGVSIASGLIYSMEKVRINDNEDHIYVAGSFTSPRNKLLKIVRTYAPATETESFSLSSSSLATSGNEIKKIIFHNNFLYVAANASSLVYLERVNVTNSTWFIDTSWDVTGYLDSMTGLVNTLAIDPDGLKLLVGGDFSFSSIAPFISRQNFIAFNLSDADVVSYSVNPIFNLNIRDIKVREGFVYVSGDFTSFDSIPTHNRAAKFAASGNLFTTVATWRPDVNASVISLATTNSGLLLGGSFTDLNLEGNNRLGKLNYNNLALPSNFNKNGQNNLSIGFSRFDLLKRFYIRRDSAINGDVNITIRDGVQNFNYVLRKTNN